MNELARSLRHRSQQIAAVKRASHDEATRAHLEQPLGARLLAAIRLSEAFVDGWPDTGETEAEVWRRVNDHLASVR